MQVMRRDATAFGHSRLGHGAGSSRGAYLAVLIFVTGGAAFRDCNHPARVASFLGLALRLGLGRASREGRVSRVGGKTTTTKQGHAPRKGGGEDVTMGSKSRRR